MKTIETIIFCVFTAIFSGAVVWIFFLYKHIKKIDSNLHYLSSDVMTMYNDITAMKEDQKKFFIRLKERYLKSLLDAVRKYKQSCKKDKKQKRTFKSIR